jgi:hypothetical protein
MNGKIILLVLSGIFILGTIGALEANAILFSSPETLTQPGFSFFGTSATTGDVNNDGYDDIIVGSAFDTVSGLQAGRVFVFLGPTFTTVTHITEPTPAAGAEFGYSVASGDINNDGIDDVIVGARGARPNDLQRAGEVFVFYGPSFTSNTRLQEAIPQVNAGFGNAVASGDINSDGVDDVIVSASGANIGGLFSAGKVYVYTGTSLSSPRILTDSVIQQSAYFGASIATGDINRDGYDDIVVGTSGANFGATINTGKIVVVSGRDYSILKTVFETTPENASNFGGAVATGDVNNDGYDDVIVGAFLADHPVYTGQKGEVFTFFGPGLTSVQNLNYEGRGFGKSVATGDLDNDGKDDVIVGDSGSKRTSIFLGSNLAARPATIFYDPTSGTGGFGNVVATGDTQNDGFFDVIVPESSETHIFKSFPPDVAPPSISGISADPANLSLIDQTTISATITDDVLVNNAVARVFGPSPLTTGVGSATLSLQSGTGQNGIWSGSFTFPSTTLAPDGDYAIAITATDSSGNAVTTDGGLISLTRFLPPVAIDDVAVTTVDQDVTLDVLTNDSDPNGEALSVSAITQGSNGAAVNNLDGTVTYTPDSGFIGEDTFTYTASDGSLTDTATVTVFVGDPRFTFDLSSTADVSWTATHWHDHDHYSNIFGFRHVGNFHYSGTPIVSGQSAEIDLEIITLDPITIEIGGDSTSLTAYALTHPDGTIETLTVGTNIINPTNLGLAKFLGTLDGAARSEIIATDPTIDHALSEVPSHPPLPTWTIPYTVTLEDDFTASFTFASNFAPVANDDVDTTFVNTPITIDVLVNDLEPNLDLFSISSITQGSNGSVVDNLDGTVTYSPDSGFVGEDTFTYAISDGSLTDTATVTITVIDSGVFPVSASGTVTWTGTISNISFERDCSSGVICFDRYTYDVSFSGTPVITESQNANLEYFLPNLNPINLDIGSTTNAGTEYEFTDPDGSTQSLVLGNNLINPTELGFAQTSASLESAVISELLLSQPSPYTTSSSIFPSPPSPFPYSTSLSDDFSIIISSGVDTDGDGIPDPSDVCPGEDDTIDVDGDGIPDCNDPLIDTDGDGVSDSTDNCPAISNTSQANLDGDSLGDACDTDADGDTLLDDVDCNDLDDSVGGPTPWYADRDGDVFGDGSNSQLACTMPSGFVVDNTDCDDLSDNVHPGAQEFVNGVDDDCDASVDEGLDVDNDTFLTAVYGGDDCDDGDPSIYPGAQEFANGVDDDCDSSIDEGLDTDADGSSILHILEMIVMILTLQYTQELQRQLVMV